jgi:hypothetical protein
MRFNGWSFEQNTRLGEAAEPDESVFFNVSVPVLLGEI